MHYFCPEDFTFKTASATNDVTCAKCRPVRYARTGEREGVTVVTHLGNGYFDSSTKGYNSERECSELS
uniref:Uncharacterized protein n=1 Tax=Romanomermis culicivorax TaxID=13658 RepID=A0A915KS32_ROMCU